MNVKCSNCSKEFDSGAQQEITQGLVECPHCRKQVNGQTGVMLTTQIAMTGKSTALIGRAHDLGADGAPPKNIVVLPGGSREVENFGTGQKIRTNATRVSAVRMEAARRQLVAKGRSPFFDYAHHELFHTGDDRKSGVPSRFYWDPNWVDPETNKKVGAVRADTAWTPAASVSLTGKPPEYEAFSPHVPIEDGEATGLYENCGGILNRGTFGPAAKFSQAADEQQLVAADPNVVAQVDAALRDEETNPAAEKETSRMFKELIAKLCAAFSIKPDGKAEADIEKELLAALDREHAGVAVLTARAGAAEPVIVALGLPKDSAIKREELVAALRKNVNHIVLVSDKDEISFGTTDELIGKELVEFAVSTGIVEPAKKDEWLGKMKRDLTGWRQELIGKTPAVLIGKVIAEQPTRAAAGATTGDKPKWLVRAEELVAKDPNLSKLERPVGISKAMEQLAKEEPAIFKEEGKK